MHLEQVVSQIRDVDSADGREFLYDRQCLELAYPHDRGVASPYAMKPAVQPWSDGRNCPEL